MKTTICVRQILNEGAVTGRHSGRVLREQVSAALAAHRSAEVDFAGVDMITQSAADEFIGRMVREDADLIERISFSHCGHNVAEMLQWAAEHAHAVVEAASAKVPA